MTASQKTLFASIAIALYGCSGQHSATPPNVTNVINDTGIVGCANASQTPELECSEPLFTQDGAIGRDILLSEASASTLEKVGSGFAGFDFTRLDTNGQTIDQTLDLSEQKALTACVQDNVTGLIWEVKSGDDTAVNFADHMYVWDLNGKDVSEVPGKCTQLEQCTVSAYLNYQINNSLCGFTDWRVPSVQELSSIGVMSKVLPAVDTDFFPHLEQPRYFTSEQRFFSADDSAAGQGDFAWYVYFSDASVSSTSVFDASSVRLVRANNKLPKIGCAEPSDQLKTTNKTVIDQRTGLEWQLCAADDESTDSCKAMTEQSKLNWMDALQFAEQSNYAGHSDWRLPNKNELETLVARDCAKPSIIGSVFTSAVYDRHWTATPNQFNPNFAWTVGFDKGEHAITPKNNATAFRMVRELKVNKD